MRQQLVAFHLYDLLLRRQPVWERGVWLDRGQMGQKDGLLRYTVPRGHILDRHQLQSQLRHLHSAQDRERPLFSSHLSNTFYTRYEREKERERKKKKRKFELSSNRSIDRSNLFLSFFSFFSLCFQRWN